MSVVDDSYVFEVRDGKVQSNCSRFNQIVRACGAQSNILFQSTILEASISKLEEIFECSGILEPSAARKKNPKEVHAYERKVSLEDKK